MKNQIFEVWGLVRQRADESRRLDKMKSLVMQYIFGSVIFGSVWINIDNAIALRVKSKIQKGLAKHLTNGPGDLG